MASIAIAIPTYNRPDILDRNLRAMMPEILAIGATVYISDDSDNTETAERIAALRAEYPTIQYRHNRPALRHDANLLSTLTWPTEDFVWLLGDARRIAPGVLSKLARFVAPAQDMIFVNVHAPASHDIPVVSGDALVPFARDRVWHQTLSGATIYARSVIDWVRARDVTACPNFPQLTVILGFLEDRHATVGWMDDIALWSDNKESYWEDRALDVFVDDWVRVITRHRKLFPREVLPSVLKEHSRRHHVFGPERLLRLKASGAFGPRSFRRPHFFDVMHLPAYRVIALAVLPPRISQLLTRAAAFVRDRFIRSRA